MIKILFYMNFRRKGGFGVELTAYEGQTVHRHHLHYTMHIAVLHLAHNNFRA